ncbi:MAG: cold shock domain-containing protein [Alphaproteobacteria bacterium]|nr:cold shock domain-containing protein [Alphaproteobacteria bacterium]MCB1550670.1 cold shock domain-containing protein [Alphaproteobacteria bacterium]MCB9985744.1 cold shock domain-containing protein [Micavibrio sp.]HPQ51201.1 cold shock domain-containing protein [Alphaproteobacteria bacterium]
MPTLSEVSLQEELPEVKAKLKWFNATKGFGFVIPEDNPVDAFLHITQLQKLGIFGLGEGAELLCRVEYKEKGAYVVEITKILSRGKCEQNLITEDEENHGLFSTKGMVKLYSEEKGYGFILPDDGMKDVFVHKSCLDRCGIHQIEPGQRVRVTFKAAEKGREAIEVSIENTF